MRIANGPDQNLDGPSIEIQYNLLHFMEYWILESFDVVNMHIQKYLKY